MTDATTIKLEPDVKDALNKENLDGETYSDTVSRLLGNAKGRTWTEQEIYQIATRAAQDEIRTIQR